MVLSGPSLKHFLLRQQVINLYRNAIRASQGNFFFFSKTLIHFPQAIVDPVTRKETLAWIRSELERQKSLTDTVRPGLSKKSY